MMTAVNLMFWADAHPWPELSGQTGVACVIFGRQPSAQHPKPSRRGRQCVSVSALRLYEAENYVGIRILTRFSRDMFQMADERFATMKLIISEVEASYDIRPAPEG